MCRWVGGYKRCDLELAVRMHASCSHVLGSLNTGQRGCIVTNAVSLQTLTQLERFRLRERRSKVEERPWQSSLDRQARLVSGIFIILSSSSTHIIDRHQQKIMGEAAVAEFISITGASRGVALRMLDACGGNLEEAAEKFFADGGASAAAPAQPAARKSAGGKSGSRSKKQNINSLATLNQQNEDSDEDDHNEYYVGGEKSGQIVKGGPKDEGRSGDPIEGIFENARASGARQGRPEDLHPASQGGGSGAFNAFGGRARTLAGGDAAPAESQDNQAEHEEETAKELTITITFYANGIFTVNDGEPRRIDDPANLQFMEAISRGQCPSELDPGDPDVHIAVNLVRRGEDYTPPAQPRFTAFAGAGRKLTDTTTDASGAAAPSTSAAAAATAAGGVASGGVPWEGADTDKPKTSIQLRLADGSRQVAEFNLDHTVGHIRKFIHAARPDMPMTYSLATAFPKAELPDDDVTIETAGLANSVVIQKMN